MPPANEGGATTIAPPHSATPHSATPHGAHNQGAGPHAAPSPAVESSPGALGDGHAPVARPTVRVALPAYNEEEALPRLLVTLHETLSRAGLPHEIVVVDDGSADRTADIALQAAESMPVRLVPHAQNMGLAAALRTCLQDAVDHAGPEDIVVTMDSDNTQPPGLIPRMLQMIEEGHDVVIASRFQPGARVIGVPFDRVLLSVAARWVFRLTQPIPGVRDYTCGFRAYRAGTLAAAIDHYEDRFVTERGFSCMVDVLLKLRKLRLTTGPVVMGEAPMVLRYDQKGGASKMAVLRTVRQTLSLVFRRLFTSV